MELSAIFALDSYNLLLLQSHDSYQVILVANVSLEVTECSSRHFLMLVVQTLVIPPSVEDAFLLLNRLNFG